MEPKTDTIPKLLRDRARQLGQRIAMRKKDYGIWNEYTWEAVYEHVIRMASGLLAMGFQRGDRVVILGDNDPEWYWAEWAAQAIGGTAIGVYIDCTPSEIEYYLEHSDAVFAFVRDQEQADKILAIQHRIPRVRGAIYWDARGLWFYEEPLLMSIRDLEELGEKYSIDHPQAVDDLITGGNGSDIAVFCYTSGTTGLPKAAMLTHRNLLYAVQALMQYNAFLPKDNYLSYISPSWVTEQMLGLTAGVLVPLVIHFPEKPETVQKDIRDIAPNIIFYGARLWENLASMIQVKVTGSTPLKRLAYGAALILSQRRLRARENGGGLSWFQHLLWRLGDAVVFRPLRDRIGLSRAKVGYTAGAAISPDMMRLFHAIGVNIKNLYGTTEASLVSMHQDGDVRYETVGTPFQGCEVRISADGEMLVRNEGVFIGYYKDPEATARVLQDGYYHTGDAGVWDKGHLVYLDRVEEMIRLAGGRSFSPQFTEIRLRFSPYIKDAMVFGGEDKPFVAALINMDFENVGKWAERKKLGFTTYLDLSQKEEVRDLLRETVQEVNRVLPDYARIKAFVSLHKEFDPDEAELTRTRKLKRKTIEEKYGEILSGIYRNEERIRVESQVAYRDGKLGTVRTEVRVNTI